jgi:hypothetical protein
MSLRDQSNAIKMVQGSTAFLPQFPLTDHKTGAPLDLTDVVSASMDFRKQGSVGAMFTVPLTILTPATGGVVQVTSWPAGPPGALDDFGMFEGEVVLTYAGGPLTIYPKIIFNIRQKFS